MGFPSWNHHQFSSINPSPYCSAFSFHKSRFSFVTFKTPSSSPNYQLASHLAACNWILIKETPWRMAFPFVCPEVPGNQTAQKQPAALLFLSQCSLRQSLFLAEHMAILTLQPDAWLIWLRDANRSALCNLLHFFRRETSCRSCSFFLRH